MKRVLSLGLAALLAAGLLAGCQDLPQVLNDPSIQANNEDWLPPWVEGGDDSASAAPATPAPGEGAGAEDSSGLALPEPPTIEEVPLAAMLHKEKAGRNTQQVYGELLVDRSKENRDIWLGRIRGAWQQLVDGGVLPKELWDKITPYTWRDTVTFTVMMDTQACEDISCSFGMGTKPPSYIQCKLEPLYGQPFGASASLPFGYVVTPAQRDAMCEAFIQYLELDAFGDWTKEEYQPKEGDLPSMDYSQYITVYNSQRADMTVSLLWQCEEEDYVMFSFSCQAGTTDMG